MTTPAMTAMRTTPPTTAAIMGIRVELALEEPVDAEEEEPPPSETRVVVGGEVMDMQTVSEVGVAGALKIS